MQASICGQTWLLAVPNGVILVDNANAHGAQRSTEHKSVEHKSVEHKSVE